MGRFLLAPKNNFTQNLDTTQKGIDKNEDKIQKTDSAATTFLFLQKGIDFGN